MFRRKKDEEANRQAIPPRAKNGVKVYYPAEEEAYLRQRARDMGMTLQQFLKWKAARERQGLPT